MADTSNMLQPEDIEEIRKAVREADTTHKEWLLAQLLGIQSDQHNLEDPSNSGKSEELSGDQQEGSKEMEEPKKRCCIASKESKKAVKRKADGDKRKTPQEAAPSTSKKLRPTDGAGRQSARVKVERRVPVRTVTLSCGVVPRQHCSSRGLCGLHGTEQRRCIALGEAPAA
ncbi:hypothetical protein NDU88_004517 [Pleurodeles waltl]|uniref:Uncharacterized protein n=1 Tax=Pleurodeles waltl TaxID=8319 RepID=A0AAV7WAK9_PLEWA|nr:hypothetical protein NDU88_004517 [Pleurodeles waltl]